jgi:hypothetical protein
MFYTWFLIILLAGAVPSVFLAGLKIFNRARISWFEVPFPFFVGWVVATVDHVWYNLYWGIDPLFARGALTLGAILLVLFVAAGIAGTKSRISRPGSRLPHLE